MDQIFHSWCMGSNLGNLDPGSPEDGDWWVVAEFLKSTINCLEELLTLNHLSTIRLCPEVRVCGFGSSPRFGSTVDGDWCAAAAEVWHRWGRSVGWEQCGRVGRVL